VLLLLFDVYLTWARIEKQTLPDTAPRQSNLGRLAQQSIVSQYIFFCKCLPPTGFLPWNPARDDSALTLPNPCSGAVCSVNIRVPCQYSLPYVLSNVPTGFNGHSSSLYASELGFDRPASVVLHETLSYTYGHLGI
jgi:hypothetical protein